MIFASTISERARRALWPAICVAAVVYFTWHTVQGRHGLRAYQVYGDQLVNLEAEAVQIKQRRDQMENQLNLLQSNAIDPDYLDELAHKKLNYMTPDEMMIEIPKSGTQKQ